MSDEHCHIVPEPAEAPEPRPVRVRDLVRGRALMHGYNVLQEREPSIVGCFPAFVEAFEAADKYMERHGGRGPGAAPELLEALKELVGIIDAAGLLNLSLGVQLGATSWYVKASDRLEWARTVISEVEGPR